MPNNVYHDKPYLVAKIGLHNQSMKPCVEWESPSKKDPKAKSYAFKGEKDEIDQRLGFYII
jgi:hypothetical protein